MPRPAQRIRKAVFPVAGLGTRFLPATKAMPKEMLTVVDRPVIQHVVDEARAAGIEHFVFVTGRNKGVIEDHFDTQLELEATLAARGKTDASSTSSPASCPSPAQMSFTRQQAPLGLGPRGLVRARHRRRRAVRACCSPTCCTMASRPCLAEMIEAYDEQRRQSHRRVAGAGGRDPPVRHRRRQGPNRQGVADHRHGREAEARDARRPTCTSPAATSCSRRSSTCSRARSAAPAAKSSSPTP